MTEERFIDQKFTDELTGLDFGLDIQGRYHLLKFLTDSAEEINKESVFMKAFHESKWADTVSFQEIRCSLTGEPDPMVIEIPADKTLRLDNIIAVTDADAISLVGVFIDDVASSFFPVRREMYYTFDEKVKLKGKLEFKFKPYNRNTKLSIFVHGLII